MKRLATIALKSLANLRRREGVGQSRPASGAPTALKAVFGVGRRGVS
jgi:hypothetical protein